MARLDPQALGSVATICVIAIAATVVAALVRSSTLGLVVLLAAGATSVAIFVRNLHHATAGLGGEKLASSLPAHLLAELDAPQPPPALLTDTLAAQAPAPGVAVAGGCPRCTARLGDAGGTWQQRDCPAGCGSLVLDSERLLVERAGLDLEIVRGLVREQGARKGTCPACSSAMHEGKLRGVTVDLCLSCGALWLDVGELDKLARAGLFASATI